MRFNELVTIHGLLDPLVSVDLRPEISVTVKIYFGEICREESISVLQSVKQFKQKLHGIFNIAPTKMRLWYYDQERHKVAGPEEMKFATKELYTYNVVDGDYFVVDEKPQLKVLTGSGKPTPGKILNSPLKPQVARNLFGKSNNRNTSDE